MRKYLADTRDFSSPAVENTLNNLGAPLKKLVDDSTTTAEDEKLAVASLKGLGNVQYLNKDLLDLTNQIIMDQSVSQRIRAATLVMMQSYAKYPTVRQKCLSLSRHTHTHTQTRTHRHAHTMSTPSCFILR